MVIRYVLFNKVDVFTSDDEKLFKNLLLLVGLAIRNASLYAETQLVADENRLLYELSKKETDKNIFLLDMAKTLGAEIDTTDVMKNILESAKKMISADIATLYLTDKSNEEVFLSNIVKWDRIC
jgi:glycine cleavage system pyridoxal-binding protein P